MLGKEELHHIKEEINKIGQANDQCIESGYSRENWLNLDTTSQVVLNIICKSPSVREVIGLLSEACKNVSPARRDNFRQNLILEPKISPKLPYVE